MEHLLFQGSPTALIWAGHLLETKSGQALCQGQSAMATFNSGHTKHKLSPVLLQQCAQAGSLTPSMACGPLSSLVPCSVRLKTKSVFTVCLLLVELHVNNKTCKNVSRLLSVFEELQTDNLKSHTRYDFDLTVYYGTTERAKCGEQLRLD